MFVVQVQDACDGGAEFEALDLAKRQANPGTIYVASTTDETFVARLKSRPDADEQSTETAVRMEASSIFSFKNAYRILQSLHVRGLGSCSSTVESLQMLNSVMDLSCSSQVCAAGALVTILHRENLLGTAQPGILIDDPAETVPGRALTVNALREVSLSRLLTLDYSTRRSLHVFSEECHPSRMGVGSTKEGLSVRFLDKQNKTVVSASSIPILDI